MQNNTVALDIQLQGEERLVGDFPARLGSHLKLLVPANVKRENISTVTRDTEILLDILKKHPAEIGALVSAELAGDSQSASEIAKMIGISEEKFKAKGGGPLWLIVIVVILVLKACEGEANIIISPQEQKFLECRIKCHNDGFKWGTSEFLGRVNQCFEGAGAARTSLQQP